MPDKITFPASIRAWVRQQAGYDVPIRLIARALGVDRARAEALLDAPPEAENLLQLNRLAQLHLLAITHRAWPNCPWFAWNVREYKHPVIELIRHVFGQDLLRLVETHFGERVLDEYFIDFESPIDDLNLPENLDDDDDPLDFVPEDQLVFNPHTEENDAQQVFMFGSPHTAACFRWMLADRQQFTVYVDNRTSLLHDPLAIQLAYDLRHSLQEDYWATLPPDTFAAYHALAHALQTAIVPEPWQEGALSLVRVVPAGQLRTRRLEVVQTDEENVWWVRLDALEFSADRINVFVVISDSDDPPAALILTTNDEPGSPEHHRESLSMTTLTDSIDTVALAFVPVITATEAIDLPDIEDVIVEVLDDTHFGLDEVTGIFCTTRDFPWYDEYDGQPIAVYRIAGGYMLQFNHQYRFTPSEMRVK